MDNPKRIYKRLWRVKNKKNRHKKGIEIYTIAHEGVVIGSKTGIGRDEQKSSKAKTVYNCRKLYACDKKIKVAREEESGERIYKKTNANAHRRNKVVFIDDVFWLLFIKSISVVGEIAQRERA